MSSKKNKEEEKQRQQQEKREKEQAKQLERYQRDMVASEQARVDQEKQAYASEEARQQKIIDDAKAAEAKRQADLLAQQSANQITGGPGIDFAGIAKRQALSAREGGLTGYSKLANTLARSRQSNGVDSEVDLEAIKPALGNSIQSNTLVSRSGFNTNKTGGRRFGY